MNHAVESGRNKGSITVEASIVVPVVILSILAVIYMGLLLYQRTLAQSAAEMAAEAGAAAWGSGINEISCGKPDKTYFENAKLYRRIFDADKEERLSIIENHALLMSARNELLRPEDTLAEAGIKDYAVSRKLEVSVTKRYSLPLGNVVRLFGGKGTVDIHVKAVASIDEPVELIRTTDFILDMERKLEREYPEIKNLGEKTREIINEIKAKLLYKGDEN